MLGEPYGGEIARVAEFIAAFRDNRSQWPMAVRARFRGSEGQVGRRDTATHWIHWYPAKMFHRIPAAILSASPSGTLTVLDPFCGSGTVLLEAVLRGHLAIGVDVNPLARLISRVKTTRLDVKILSERAGEVLRAARGERSVVAAEQLPAYWFLPGACRALLGVVREIHDIHYRPHRDFLRICLSAVVRQSSLADPSVPPPVRLSPERARRASVRYNRDLERALSVTPTVVHQAFADRVQLNIARVSELSQVTPYGRPRILGRRAEAAATGLPRNSVDLIITSPPYCGAQKYVRSLSLEMLALGFRKAELAAADRRTLGTERLSVRDARERLHTGLCEADSVVQDISEVNLTRALMVAEYVRYLGGFAKECARVLRRDGEAFVTFGSSRVAGRPIAWDEFFRPLALRAGLTLVGVLIDRIPSRGLMTTRHYTSNTIDDERVVWLRKTYG